MELIWIPISIFAALMQAVRTAAQKTLNQTMSTMGTTYVRSLFGLPFLALFDHAVFGHRKPAASSSSSSLVAVAVAAAAVPPPPPTPPGQVRMIT